MLEIKFFGKEPEACIAMVKNDKGEASIEVKGSTRDILSMLTIMVAALKKRLPFFLVDAAIRYDATEDLNKNATVIDVTEFMKQSGK